jgi:hypothetical protein
MHSDNTYILLSLEGYYVALKEDSRMQVMLQEKGYTAEKEIQVIGVFVGPDDLLDVFGWVEIANLDDVPSMVTKWIWKSIVVRIHFWLSDE